MGEKKQLGFFENFMLSGVAAGVSKTAAAPIGKANFLFYNLPLDRNHLKVCFTCVFFLAQVDPYTKVVSRVQI